jgi:hypothetical protein
MVDNIRSQVAACCGSRVSVVGGSDMEMSPPTLFTGPYSTTLWVNSYVAATTCIPGAGDAGCLYDYGAVAAQPGGPCSQYPQDPWTYCDVWYISWGVKKGGNRMDRPLPQIYHTAGTDATGWHDLSIYSLSQGDGLITPAGILTQRGSCEQSPQSICSTTNNTPGQGWLQLWGALYADTATRVSTLHWTTDIKYQCYPTVKTCGP